MGGDSAVVENDATGTEVKVSKNALKKQVTILPSSRTIRTDPVVASAR